ncbi:MAG: response regulator [Methylibium sp.]|nr:response regulator [Methylibium sp.]
MCGILIVDDDASIRFAMADYFAAKGLRAESVASREEVEARLADGHYAIVITDLCLTPYDNVEGLEIVRLVAERHSPIVCIVLTAYGSPDSEATARRYGAHAFLQKPRPMSELLELVARLLPAGNSCPAPDESRQP